MSMYKIIETILRFIYPSRCVFCEEIIALGEEGHICRYCDMEINYISYDKEPKLYVFEYDDITRFSILRLKYSNKRQYAKTFAKMMAKKFEMIEHLEYDCIINVPMYKKKKKKRGYDQAELIAKDLSDILNIEFEKENLVRIKNTLPQSKVSFEQRQTNVKNVFKVLDPDRIEGKNIILVDDIYTTGNTLNECAKELKQAGANNICYFTLAKTSKKQNL